ncbi:MAG: flagellar basal body rod protein FlgC [Pseudomonadota bacterium]
MSGNPIFDVAGSALHAQSTRLNTIASNLANAENVSGNPQDVYRAREPVFVVHAIDGNAGTAGVQVAQVVESQAAPVRRHEPGHPMADGDGYVYAPDIDTVAQMVNMISAARSFQANVEVLNTAKELSLLTLNMNAR